MAADASYSTAESALSAFESVYGQAAYRGRAQLAKARGQDEKAAAALEEETGVKTFATSSISRWV